MGNGFSIKQILVVVVVLGLFTFIMIGANSNAYKDDSNSNYEQVKVMIIHNAKLYGESITEWPEENTMIVTLDDLVKNGYYEADDSDGNVENPLNSNGSLNGLKIKLIHNEDGSVDANIIEEE